jgi:hypothetical protein
MDVSWRLIHGEAESPLRVEGMIGDDLGGGGLELSLIWVRFLRVEKGKHAKKGKTVSGLRRFWWGLWSAFSSFDVG